MNRREVLKATIAAAGAILLPRTAAFAATPHDIFVAKTATCGCCAAWVEHLQAAGFRVTTENVSLGRLMAFKTQHGIPPQLAACHTARVSGYTIEGHVPAADVKRLLKERPNAIGLTVPDMPIGSPGMEVGSQRDAYDVLLVALDGSTTVFAHYPEKA